MYVILSFLSACTSNDNQHNKTNSFQNAFSNKNIFFLSKNEYRYDIFSIQNDLTPEKQKQNVYIRQKCYFILFLNPENKAFLCKKNKKGSGGT